jgi:ankyrin repeat protein
MDLKPPAFDAALEQYQQQAEQLLQAHRARDPQAIQLIHENNPRFLDENTPWLPKSLQDSEIQSAPFDIADAQLTIARIYNFKDWPALTGYVDAVRQPGSAVLHFESAAEAVITGDLPALHALLREHPELVRARSTRITNFDPPVHRATLLHYVAANGVESYRQKTPSNALEIARALLTAGAEPDALARMYGGDCTTMSMLVSSTHPAQAGLQVGLVETLVEFGASVEARGEGRWTSPLMTALVFGYLDAGEALVRLGARVENIATAAGLGRLAETKSLLPTADAESRHRALALAAQLGHVDVVRLLLDAGEDPNRYNPEGTHSHATPLHNTIAAGHLPMVRLLVERGARLDIKDTLFQGTPLGWAEYLKKTEIENYLRERYNSPQP